MALDRYRRLADRVAIVTGSSSGIGAEVAQAFAREGARVVINHLGERSQAEAVAARIQSAGGQALVIEADVADARQVRGMIEETHAIFGGIDTLVNNAGIYPRDEWNDLTEQQWDRVLDVNLKGCYLCAHAVSPDMKTAGFGKIINVSSIVVAAGGFVHYATSKAGIVGLTRGLAIEMGAYNACVNAVLPGAIRVERERELDSVETRERNNRDAMARQCLKRRGTATDVVGAFLFFASHESDWITGHCLSVDGGYTLY